MNLVTTTSFFLIVFWGEVQIIDAASYEEFTNDTSAAIDRNTPLTHEQEILIEEFRNENSAILTDDYLRSKSHIEGALRVKKWNKQDAAKQLKRVLQWRATNKLDELGEAERDKEMLELFPNGVDAYSREGCPVTNVDFGDWHIDEFMLSKEYVRDAIHALRRHFNQLFEKGRRASKNLVTKNPKCDHNLMFIDARNFTMAQVAESNALNTCIYAATTLETYYQNLYKHFVFINCSEDFRSLMKNLQPYLAYTGRAMVFYNESESEQARKDIFSLADPKQLPTRYYGTKM